MKNIFSVTSIAIYLLLIWSQINTKFYYQVLSTFLALQCNTFSLSDTAQKALVVCTSIISNVTVIAHLF